ncbi:thioredoxin family protein [Alkalihalophilus pseudofirmus]|uniref:bacillithiol system redox-active protein YtxJ n=1 Tax=Alkalihalobacterium alkalinitrilicum TaxID=427920 RepID=UPI00094CAF17|nr:bacillithiol system redox-active protein YtxJ [Alkalihalobacterium alkalinitrilicum]OLO40216.1 thioredoxin family protein [Alkalihalophilus pseudofirmus]
MQKVNTTEELIALLNEHNKLFLLKNSTTCPISHTAYNEFTQFAEGYPEETFYYLNVQEARPLSNEIAEKFEVKHESPQVLLFSNGQVVWHTSHWNVTVSNLESEWSKI